MVIGTNDSERDKQQSAKAGRLEDTPEYRAVYDVLRNDKLIEQISHDIEDLEAVGCWLDAVEALRESRLGIQIEF